MPWRSKNWRKNDSGNFSVLLLFQVCKFKTKKIQYHIIVDLASTKKKGGAENWHYITLIYIKFRPKEFVSGGEKSVDYNISGSTNRKIQGGKGGRFI